MIFLVFTIALIVLIVIGYCLCEAFIIVRQAESWPKRIIAIIGLAAKNAILIVEFAKVRVDRGMEPVKAAIEAAGLRLRPILMTSFAFIIGCIPLAIATGAGAAARNGMGVAVVGGMLFATALGIFLIPVFFVGMEWIAAKL